MNYYLQGCGASSAVGVEGAGGANGKGGKGGPAKNVFGYLDPQLFGLGADGTPILVNAVVTFPLPRTEWSMSTELGWTCACPSMGWTCACPS